jgi:hypothetical protein
MHASLLLLPISSLRLNAALDKMYQNLSITISVRVQGQTDPTSLGVSRNRSTKERRNKREADTFIWVHRSSFSDKLGVEGDYSSWTVCRCALSLSLSHAHPQTQLQRDSETKENE